MRLALRRRHGVMVAFAFYFRIPNSFIMFHPFPIRAKWAILGMVALDLFGGIIHPGANDNIAHFAHLGGAVTGFILVWDLGTKQTGDRCIDRLRQLWPARPPRSWRTFAADFMRGYYDRSYGRPFFGSANSALITLIAINMIILSRWLLRRRSFMLKAANGNEGNRPVPPGIPSLFLPFLPTCTASVPGPELR